MSADQSLNHRLINLAKLLEQVPIARVAEHSQPQNPIVARLSAVAEVRLRALGQTLEQRLDQGELDAEDALLLRLLLEDYTAGVAHLRAIASAIDERLTAIRSVIKEGRRVARLERARTQSPNTPQS